MVFFRNRLVASFIRSASVNIPSGEILILLESNTLSSSSEEKNQKGFDLYLFGITGCEVLISKQ